MTKWTKQHVDRLPDSCFALILPGGKIDDKGKTRPRILRKFPYRDAKGKINVAHLRNAMARLGRSKITKKQKDKALKVLLAAEKKAGVGQYHKKKRPAKNPTTTKIPRKDFQSRICESICTAMLIFSTDKSADTLLRR